MKQKRLLIIGDFISGSGLTEFIFNMFSHFDSTKYKIQCVGYGNDFKGESTQKCKRLNWQLDRVIPVTKNPIEHIKWWKKFFKKNNFDIIYFNYSSSWNYFPIKIAKKNTTATIVCHSHNSYYSHKFNNKVLMLALNMLNNRGKRILNKYVDIKLATSKDAARWMFNTVNNINIIDNGIELKNFKFDKRARKELRDKLSVSENKKIIGFAGAFVERKNPIFALHIFSKYFQSNSDVVLLMIGKGPLNKKIKETAIELGILKQIKFIPYTDQLNKWYSAMDVLIFPSLYEGFGLVPLEAQVSNLPVLASNKIAPQVFATENIKSISTFNEDEWVKNLSEIQFKQNEERELFIESLDKFDVKSQALKVSKILESIG